MVARHKFKAGIERLELASKTVTRITKAHIYALVIPSMQPNPSLNEEVRVTCGYRCLITQAEAEIF